MSNNLYLVGTIHFDLDGETKLDTLLDRIQPSVVALEFHRDREDMQLLRKSPKEEETEINKIINEFGLDLNPKQRATLIKSGRKINDVIGYEFRSSINYIRRNPTSRLEYIDISVFEKGKEEFVKGYTEAMKFVFKQIIEEPEITKPLFKMLNEGIDVFLEHLRRNTRWMYQNPEEIGELFEMMRNPKTFKKIKGVMHPLAVQALEQVYNPQRDEVMATKIRELYDGDSKLVVIVGLGHLVRLETKLRDLKLKVMTLAEYDSI